MGLTRQRFSVVLIAGLVTAACGGSGDNAATPASRMPGSDTIGAPRSNSTTSAVVIGGGDDDHRCDRSGRNRDGPVAALRRGGPRRAA